MNSIFSVITKILSLVIIFIVIYVTLAVLLLMGFISMQLSITAIIAALIPAFLIYLICAVLISNSNHLGSPVPIKIGRTLLYAVLSGMLGFLILSGDYVRNRIDRVFVHRYYAQAEDIISYDHKSIYQLMGLPLHHNSIFVDYDKMHLTFVYYTADYKERFRTYILRKTDANPFTDLNLQSQYPLSSPGKTIFTYYKTDYAISAGVVIKMNDGTFYYAKIPDENLDFDLDRKN